MMAVYSSYIISNEDIPGKDKIPFLDYLVEQAETFIDIGRQQVHRKKKNQ